MIIGFVFMCISAFYCYINKYKGNIFLSLFFFLVIPIVFGYIILTLYDTMTEVRGYEASENGRVDVWETYFSYLGNHYYVCLFGTGAGTIGDIAEKLNNATAHNLFLEKIIECGIIGCVFLFAFFLNLYNKASFSLKNNVKLIPLITFLGTCLTQGTTGSLTFALLLSIFPIAATNNVTDKCP